MYLLGGHIAYLFVEEVVELQFEFVDACSFANSSIANLLHFPAQYLVVDVLWVLVAVVWLGAILIYIVYQHGAHASHADVFLAAREVILQCFLVEHHAGYVGSG